MNLREGMRRVGIVLGVLGFLVGGTIGYLRLRKAWRNHTRFERLCSLPIMGGVRTAIKEGHAPPPKTLPADVWDRTLDELGIGRVPIARKAAWFEKHVPGLDDPNIEWTVDVRGVDGVQTVDADKSGVITAIQLSSGEWVHKEPQTLRAHLAFFGGLLLLLLYPLIGFLIPWGAIRTLAWVVSGFSTPTTTA